MLCGRRCHLRITRRVVHRRNGIDETIGAQPAINTTALRSNCTRARPHRPLPYRFVLSRACAPREGTTERADGLRNFGLIPNGVSPGEAWRPGGSGSEDKRTSYCSRAWTGPSNTASDKVAVAGYRRTARRCRGVHQPAAMVVGACTLHRTKMCAYPEQCSARRETQV